MCNEFALSIGKASRRNNWLLKYHFDILDGVLCRLNEFKHCLHVRMSCYNTYRKRDVHSYIQAVFEIPLYSSILNSVLVCSILWLTLYWKLWKTFKFCDFHFFYISGHALMAKIGLLLKEIAYDYGISVLVGTTSSIREEPCLHYACNKSPEF